MIVNLILGLVFGVAVTIFFSMLDEEFNENETARFIMFLILSFFVGNGILQLLFRGIY